METGSDRWVGFWWGTGQELWEHKGENTLVSKDVESVTESLGLGGRGVGVSVCARTLKPY